MEGSYCFEALTRDERGRPMAVLEYPRVALTASRRLATASAHPCLGIAIST